MKIVKILGTSKEEIESKKFNVWIGISLGNKYFTEENIKEYLIWALENTKEDVLVIIGDRLYAIKLEALDKYNKLRAFKVAARLGDKKEKEIMNVIKKFPEEKRKLIKIARFKGILNTKYYEYRLELLQEHYKENKLFKGFVIKIVQNIYGGGPHTLTEKRIDKLAEYVLREVPVYLNGAYYPNSSKGKYYQCTIYPGLNLIDELIIGLHNGNLFQELSNKLKLHNEIAILEGYVD